MRTSSVSSSVTKARFPNLFEDASIVERLAICRIEFTRLLKLVHRTLRHRQFGKLIQSLTGLKTLIDKLEDDCHTLDSQQKEASDESLSELVVPCYFRRTDRRPSFDDPIDFLDMFESRTMERTGEERVQLFHLAMPNTSAYPWPLDKSDWMAARRLFVRHFVRSHDASRHWRRFIQIHQSSMENIAAYVQRYNVWRYKATFIDAMVHEDTQTDPRQTRLFSLAQGEAEHFMNSLKNRKIKSRTRRLAFSRGSYSLEQVIDWAMDIESHLLKKKQS